MKRKYKILISVIIATAIMITGSAATVMAEDDPAADMPVPELWGYCDVMLELINQAVDEGLITPEEAEELIAWWEDRPELIDELFDSTGVFHLVRNRNMHMYSYKTKPTLAAGEGNVERSKLQIKCRYQNLNGNALGNGAQNQIKIQMQGGPAMKLQARGVSAGQMRPQNALSATE